jgi:hypothetical protein
VKEKMRTEYGFNHDAMVDIESAEQAGNIKGDIVKADPRHPSQHKDH